jgi:hypothetical protein
MADSNVNFIGSVNGADANLTEQRALYLKAFSGEVILSFEANTVVLDKHMVRTATKSKTVQFPIIGRGANAAYHTPGAEITGQNINQAERNISADKLLITHVFIADVDEVLAHFEARSAYTTRMGQKLGLTFDNHVMREIALAAAASATISGEDGGLVVTDADLASGTAATKFGAWEDLFFAAAENFDNKYVNDGERYAVIKPADKNFLVRYVQDSGMSAINRDYGGVGSYASGSLYKIADIAIVASPSLPTADYSGEEFHAVDMRNTKALIFTKSAVGTVKWMDLSLQEGWDIRRQGTLMVARYLMGHGILQPECAILAKTS